METLQTLEDYVFSNRNRSYGAYELRQVYGKNIRLALLIGVSFFLLTAFSPLLFAKITKPEIEVKAKLLTKDVIIEEPEPLPEPPVVTPLPPVETQPVNTYKLLQPEITPDVLVKEEVDVTQKMLQDHQAGSQTVLDGSDMPAVVDISDHTGGIKNAIVEIKPSADNDAPLLNVEIQPEFPGGIEALNRFLQKNLRYPTQAQQANVSGRVFVSFVVDRDGSISQIEVEKGIGFGCDEEARRVLREMPRWKPGRQQGRSVRCRFHLPIAFTLE
ncbi:energy transducer TonB [Siphonobacter sp. SORGH_AS_0500]|uniref:energy transducer TonB n=1 Tax=Siphonobacter sp. SORGH_AS_0500 TaxID=1864824 RepID=UPI002859CCB0|nr:energy transducer TonB [Siphonobacter sp. SORGH_AS_0500]MDR6193795.1 protein TonB [Siphonobacter sp. SORGH_AS_0500]